MKLFVESFRVLAALLAAAATAAMAFAGYGTILTWSAGEAALGPSLLLGAAVWLPAFVVALGHAVILGLPAYLVLRWAGWTGWWVSLACGFAIGCLPFAIYFSPFDNAASFSQVGDKVLIENGVTTPAGWIDYGKTVAGLGLLGLIGGLAAWLTWYGLGRLFPARGSAAAHGLQH
jgi:hypothetical protein